MKTGDIFVAAPSSLGTSVMNRSASFMSALREGLGANYRFKQEPEKKEGDDANNPQALHSSLEIPGYNNSNINGKGYSFNPHPQER